MGIAKGALNVLCTEALRRPLEGRILTLGRMDIHFGVELLHQVARQRGVRLQEVVDPPPPIRSVLQSKGFISDQHALKALGFSEVLSLDVSDYESADVQFDLNLSDPPSELRGTCDMVFDGGTIEHVFHLPNCFANIHKMLRVGGRVVHVAPSTNHVDHGFYMFSPTLFWDYYTANGYEIETIQIFRYTPDHQAPWEVSNYEPGCLWQVAFGGLDDALYGIICVATKTGESTCDKIPVQSDCIAHWERRPAEEEAAEAERVQREAPLAPTSAEPKRRKIHSALARVWSRVAPQLSISDETRRRLELLGQSLSYEAPPPPKGLGLEVIAEY